MLDSSARPGEVLCDPQSDDAQSQAGCGSDIAFPYFISFYVLCSFLVISFKYANDIPINGHQIYWSSSSNHGYDTINREKIKSKFWTPYIL